MSIAWVEISQKNLYHNIAQFKRLAPQSEIWPVVKSNAYGHGLEEIVELLDRHQDTAGFMVVNLSEALLVRQLSQKPIMVLSYFQREERRLRQAADQNISLPVYDFETIKYLDSLGQKFLVNIKIDTGTARLGFWPEEASEAIGQVKASKNLTIYSVFTHYAESESRELGFSQKQLRAIEAIRQKYPELKIHSACSAAAIGLPNSRQDIIRLGISLYGLWPSQATKDRAKDLKIDLRPVLSLKSQIIQVKEIAAGQSIGYDRTYISQEGCRLAVVAIGYFEGVSRKLSNRGRILWRGQSCPIRGNVCMNLLMAELPRDSQAKAGDPVTIIGQEDSQTIALAELAELSETINYEVAAKINPELPRKIINI